MPRFYFAGKLFPAITLLLLVLPTSALGQRMPELLIREGDPSGTGAGEVFDNLPVTTPLFLNDNVDIAFFAGLRGAPGEPPVPVDRNIGLFVERSGTPELLIREGDPSGTGAGEVFDNLPVTTPLSLNNAGDIAFFAGLRGAPGEPAVPVDRNIGLFVALAAVQGDYSGNGTVGPEDFEAWANSFGSTVTAGEGADGNGDAVISAADYTIWRDNLPLASSSFAAASIPEPGSLVLVAMPAVLLIAGRRRGPGQAARSFRS